MKHLYLALSLLLLFSLPTPLWAVENEEALFEIDQPEPKNIEDCFTPEQRQELDDQWESDQETLPVYFSLDLDELRQYPEYPTGCEPTSLTIALNHYGFDLDKNVIPEKYLIYTTSDMIDGFLGDPTTETGAGIFPPALVETANDFLKDKNSSLQAYNTSGKSFGELLSLTADNIPVLLWVTYDYTPPIPSDMESVDEEGRTYNWYWNEHCVVINAYDLDQNLVYLADPNYGYLAVDLDELRLLVAAVGGYSMAIS